MSISALYTHRTHAIVAVFVATAIFDSGHRTASAQLSQGRPSGVSDVGIDDCSGNELPLDATFRNARGQDVRLGQYFDGSRPVVLAFHYSACPMLCRLQLRGLVDAVGEMQWTAGAEYRVLAISIDPSETSEQAAAARQRHLSAYGRPGSENGWTFLTGSSEAIASATGAAGFRYRFLPEKREFSHAASIIVCTPDGVISRYLYGVRFDPETLRLSLAEAAEGELGSPLDQLLLFCFRYDSASGKYTPAAWNLMRLGAICTTAALGAFLIPAWLRRRRRESTGPLQTGGSVA